MSWREQFDKCREWLERRKDAIHACCAITNIVLLIGGILFTGISLFVLTAQVKENTRTNAVAVRTQLYQTELSMTADESSEHGLLLNTLWTTVPTSVGRQEYASTLMGLVTIELSVKQATSAEALFEAVYDLKSVTDQDHAEVVRLFNHAETLLYHLANGFDDTTDRIITPAEYDSWRGMLEQTHAHPIMLAAIFEGHEYRYFSKRYAQFLQQELCGDAARNRSRRPAEFDRDCDFVRYFYPEMLKPDWADSLPDYPAH